MCFKLSLGIQLTKVNKTQSSDTWIRSAHDTRCCRREAFMTCVCLSRSCRNQSEIGYSHMIHMGLFSSCFSEFCRCCHGMALWNSAKLCQKGAPVSGWWILSAVSLTLAGCPTLSFQRWYWSTLWGRETLNIWRSATKCHVAVKRLICYLVTLKTWINCIKCWAWPSRGQGSEIAARWSIQGLSQRQLDATYGDCTAWKLRVRDLPCLDPLRIWYIWEPVQNANV